MYEVGGWGSNEHQARSKAGCPDIIGLSRKERRGIGSSDAGHVQSSCSDHGLLVKQSRRGGVSPLLPAVKVQQDVATVLEPGGCPSADNDQQKKVSKETAMPIPVAGKKKQDCRRLDGDGEGEEKTVESEVGAAPSRA